jgi:hypothetical protein
MSRFVVKQPNGLYCIFSTVVDAIVVYDMTVEEVGQEYVERETQNTKATVERALSLWIEDANKAFEMADTGNTIFRNWKDVKRMSMYNKSKEEKEEQKRILLECEKKKEN